MPLKNLLLLLLFSFWLHGCSSGPGIKSGTVHTVPIGKKINLENSVAVKNQLYNQHKNWRGVKYKMGGLDKNGIDCSGFVYTTFRAKLGINLPRSTELQSTTGQDIGRHQLRAGDLVFFKTDTKVRHVGIYIENNQFLHASTSRGVMISKLDNIYWKEKFWKARRP